MFSIAEPSALWMCLTFVLVGSLTAFAAALYLRTHPATAVAR